MSYSLIYLLCKHLTTFMYTWPIGFHGEIALQWTPSVHWQHKLVIPFQGKSDFNGGCVHAFWMPEWIVFLLLFQWLGSLFALQVAVEVYALKLESGTSDLQRPFWSRRCFAWEKCLNMSHFKCCRSFRTCSKWIWSSVDGHLPGKVGLGKRGSISLWQCLRVLQQGEGSCVRRNSFYKRSSFVLFAWRFFISQLCWTTTSCFEDYTI